ncbi:hypothetical protein [Terrabacter sp. 2YAF2]|uniref:hypothetical protein n=1 Tax=Terrabacter sp. 2YAF2 TaxID=3233026 RepID=UPI003F968282
MVAWADLSEAERDVMMMASEESPLWEFALTRKMGDGPTQAPMGIAAGRALVRRLMEMDLVSMFRLSEPDAVMSNGEVTDVLAATEPWDLETGPSVWVSLCLTPVGESLYYDDQAT